jgi:hypothetical protein
MEKKLTNSGPFMESTSKHSIYTSLLAAGVPQHLGLHRTTLYLYVHGDGSLKARGQALLTSWGETVRTAGPCHPQ